MSLFYSNKTVAQTRYDKIIETSNNLYRGEIGRCKQSFDDLWSGLTMQEAQEVLDLFGVEAAKLFTIHKAWQDFIKTVDPTYEYLVPPYEVTFNEDGTVTLSEKEVISSSSSSVDN